jgi:hypothetical protein
LITPICTKAANDAPWPDEKVFYYVTADGLFICRNHEFFRSSVKVRSGPAELGTHRQFLEISYPKVPRPLLELAVGFFARAAALYDAEAAALLVWNTQRKRVELVVPAQVSTVARTWTGWTYPIDVKYELPSLPPHLVLLGDMHIHVDGRSFS